MDSALNILLVDDEKRILDLFQEMLHDMGYRVTAVADPSAALAALDREKFDIAFLDQMLGPMLGLDLMERLAAADPDLSFVVVTANGSSELAADAFRRGASAFVTKPFFEEDIIRSIASVCSKRELDNRQRGFLTALE